MAFSYKQRTCATCGGTLQIDPQTKEMVCIYCGNRYEREESYDGQFSPRNAAVQTLNSLLDLNADMSNWDMVQTNLNDCQKIDPNYPGAIVARLTASIKRVQLMMATNREAVRTDLAQAQSEYRRLQSPFDPRVSDVEADFYEQLDSSDIRSLLISVFKTFQDDARVQFISQGFNAGDIHSERAASDLMNRAFANQDYSQIDSLLRSPAQLDADALFTRLLKEYPANERKQGNISEIVMRGVDQQHGRDALSDYVMSSADPVALKNAITVACVARGVIPNGAAIARLIASSNDEASVSTMLNSLKGGVLTDEDTAAIVDALLANAGPAAMTASLNALSDEGYYLTFSQQAIMAMLTRADLTVDAKASIWKTLVNIGVGEKRKQSVMAAYIETSADVDSKVKLINVLAEQMHSINPMNVENYLMNSHVDGAAKPRVLDTLLAHVTSFASLGMAARQYPAACPDPPQVRDMVLQVLTQRRLLA
ncbi:hypothetical protein JS530_00745 [Bifidobacterium sp. LC6]|uniref:HEAT repeat domain-containing protein n=1 Tax=Bifidobacterium colobi TaxID=2809026 RepID=A0ABS5USY5_9BIFI|nr:hypothetical protein [Bifidobacterium colobi]MBT1174059.1 hypothetical protein [Bifidobacterium colobi]